MPLLTFEPWSGARGLRTIPSRPLAAGMGGRSPYSGRFILRRNALWRGSLSKFFNSGSPLNKYSEGSF